MVPILLMSKLRLQEAHSSASEESFSIVSPEGIQIQAPRRYHVTPTGMATAFVLLKDLTSGGLGRNRSPRTLLVEKQCDGSPVNHKIAM